MRFTLDHFWLPKFGNEQADYEDAFAPKSNGTIDQESLSLAIADGATESSFASDWAKMLTRAFVKEPFTNLETLQARTEILSNRWQTFVNRRPLPWYAEEKVRLGAFATLLGVKLASSRNGLNNSGSWSAIAIGDTCLFQVRNDNLIRTFPISSAGEFGNSPTLLSSNLARNSRLWNNVRFQTEEWKTGDIFLLATDALACWFLSQHERNEKPWNILLGFTGDPAPSESFKSWTDKVRSSETRAPGSSSQLKNDDICLLLLKV
jgi:hypothetical protein